MERTMGVICHSIFLDQVIKNRRFQVKLSRMNRADTEKVRYLRVDCQRFPHVPGDGLSVIQPGACIGNTLFWDCRKNCGLM